MTLSAEQRRKLLSMARHLLPDLAPFSRLPAAEMSVITGALRDAEAKLEQPIVFRWLDGDRFEVGLEGDTQIVTAPVRAAFAAWLAIDDPGALTVRATDFSAPDADHADVSVRKALRKALATWAERLCPELAHVLRGLRVVDERVVWEPPIGARRVITR